LLLVVGRHPARQKRRRSFDRTRGHAIDVAFGPENKGGGRCLQSSDESALVGILGKDPGRDNIPVARPHPLRQDVEKRRVTEIDEYDLNTIVVPYYGLKQPKRYRVTRRAAKKAGRYLTREYGEGIEAGVAKFWRVRPS
jgi:hypothetical protein